MKKLITIIILAATLMVARAETYSENVVGYVLKRFYDGFQLVANPLDFKGNTIKTIFGEHITTPLTVYKYNADTGFSINSFDTDFSEWADPAQELFPGEGFFLHIPKDPADTNNVPAYVGTMIFIGEVRTGELSTHLYNGFSLVSSQAPQSGYLGTDLKFPTNDDVTIYQYQSGRYFIGGYDTDFEEWSWEGLEEEPYIQLAESFWVSQNNTSQWVRNFKLEDIAPQEGNGFGGSPRRKIGPMGGDGDGDAREGEGVLSIETKMSAGMMTFRLSATQLAMDIPYYLEFTNGSRKWATIHINGLPMYMMNKSLDFENTVSSFWFAVREAVNPALFRLRKYEPEGDGE